MLNLGIYLCLDESVPLKSPWGINIMKKTKKVVPKAFGVKLEDCQPGVNNKVGADHLSLESLMSVSLRANPVCLTISVHPAHCGDLLRPRGGDGSGVHRHLQGPWE